MKVEYTNPSITGGCRRELRVYRSKEFRYGTPRKDPELARLDREAKRRAAKPKNGVIIRRQPRSNQPQTLPRMGERVKCIDRNNFGTVVGPQRGAHMEVLFQNKIKRTEECVLIPITHIRRLR